MPQEDEYYDEDESFEEDDAELADDGFDGDDGLEEDPAPAPQQPRQQGGIRPRRQPQNAQQPQPRQQRPAPQYNAVQDAGVPSAASVLALLLSIIAPIPVLILVSVMTKNYPVNSGSARLYKIAKIIAIIALVLTILGPMLIGVAGGLSSLAAAKSMGL